MAVINIACSPIISRNGYEKPELIKVPDCTLIIKENIRIDPAIGVVLGTLDLGDTRFSALYSEKAVMQFLRTEACTMGADIINIRGIKRPGGFGTSFRCTADFIRLNEAINKASISSLPKYDNVRIEKRDKIDRMRMGLFYVGFMTMIMTAIVVIGHNY